MIARRKFLTVVYKLKAVNFASKINVKIGKENEQTLIFISNGRKIKV